MEFTGTARKELTIAPRPIAHGDVVPVTLGRTAVDDTPDQILGPIIRSGCSKRIAFNRYREFVDSVMTGEDPTGGQLPGDLTKRWAEIRPFGMQTYQALKTTTEFYLMHEIGILPDWNDVASEESRRMGRSVSAGELESLRASYYGELRQNGGGSRLPYIEQIISRLQEIPIKDPASAVGGSYGINPARLVGPLCLELIWSYWHEEAMLTQTINAISLRFQNIRGSGRRVPDPLARLEIDPLRPMNNILWGYVQDEWDRLSVVRRAYEYDHQYGLTLIGKAVPPLRSADRRSKFLNAFHNLLHMCAQFFRDDDDTTVIADGFPLLNTLREVHIILAHGAHNQFGDLAWTARVEMLIQQWILGRPEMREFLGGRVMVPYREGWMDRVDAVKSMMGWTDVSVTHFNDLATFGEQILLSIRYGAWTTIDNPASAANWARYWRGEIQGYIHAYRAVTGVDLTDRVDDTMPAIHISRRTGGRGELQSGRGNGSQIARSRRQARHPSARELGGW